LYEYIRTKEYVLFLVYQSINDQVYQHLKEKIHINRPSIENIVETIDSYFRLVNEMQEETIILYQEVKSLHTTMKDNVLQQEREMVELLKRAIFNCRKKVVTMQEAELIANNVFIQGQMWAFRRWNLQQQFTIDDYIQMQVELFYRSIGMTTDYGGLKDGTN